MQFEEQGAPSGDPSKKLEGVRAHGPFFAAIAQRGYSVVFLSFCLSRPKYLRLFSLV